MASSRAEPKARPSPAPASLGMPPVPTSVTPRHPSLHRGSRSGQDRIHPPLWEWRDKPRVPQPHDAPPRRLP